MPFAHQEQVKLGRRVEYGDIEAQNERTLAFKCLQEPLPFAHQEQGDIEARTRQ